MTVTETTRPIVETDAEGFLLDPADWNRVLAEDIGARTGFPS
jgi:sulfur relay (sulfurtransferase) DsrC/TusE family protein